jgi:hypothetical protein
MLKKRGIDSRRCVDPSGDDEEGLADDGGMVDSIDLSQAMRDGIVMPMRVVMKRVDMKMQVVTNPMIEKKEEGPTMGGSLIDEVRWGGEARI